MASPMHCHLEFDVYFHHNVDCNLFYLLFSYLIASMGLQVLWSFGLACLDMYALRRKRDLQNPILVSLFVVGDWVFILSHELVNIYYFFQ